MKKRKAPPLFWVFLIIFSVFLLKDGCQQQKLNSSTLNVNQLYEAIDADLVESLSVNAESGNVEVRFKDGKLAIVRILDFQDLQQKALVKNVEIGIEPPPSFLIRTLPYILPTLIFIIFLFWVFRSQSNSKFLGVGGDISGSEIPKERFSDVAGCDEVVEEAKKIVDFFHNPDKYRHLGARVPKGILLVGPPGTGKTLLCRAIAGETDAPFLVKPGSGFVELLVGQGAREVRKLFAEAKKQVKQNKRCIVFIDEIDAVGRARGFTSLSHDEREQTLNQLLSEMDGFEQFSGILVFGATNRPEILDPALLRRFDQRLEMPLPDIKGREAILRVHAKKFKFSKDIDFSRIARGTSLSSGDKLEKILNESAMLAAVRGSELIEGCDLSVAMDKVLFGLEKKNRVKLEEELRRTAYHEAGHVIAARHTTGMYSVRKVTIIPRGNSGGATFFLPERDHHIFTEEFLRVEMIVSMGGSAAESLIFEDRSNGPSMDFQQATQIAKRMVVEFGMSDKIGRVAFQRTSEFLGAVDHFDCAPETRRLIDEEVKALTDWAYVKAFEILKEYRDEIERLTKALLEKETLDADEIDLILSGIELVP